MSLATGSHADRTPRPASQTGTGRGRLRVVPAPPEEAPPPPLRLRALPQASPEPWHPRVGASVGLGGLACAAAPGAPAGAGQHGPGPEQHAFVLHGLPGVVAEPDLLPSRTTDVADLPCPEQLARRLVQAAVDVVRGHRPASQVLRWTTPEVYSQLRQRARLEQAAGRTGGRRPVVRSLRTARCGERGVEVSAVVLDGNRARAVAARLDGEESRWRLTALVIG